eukprot:6189782-Pleurochrysis_carterae.AAC.2
MDSGDAVRARPNVHEIVATGMYVPGATAINDEVDTFGAGSSVAVATMTCGNEYTRRRELR